MFVFLFLLMIPEEVANGLEPLNAKNLVFRQDLRFGVGTSDEDAYLWSSPETSLAVDAEGNIYVADPGETRIVAFDKNGKFLKMIATMGQGPGELFSLGSFHILADGRAIAQERVRMRPPQTHFFDKNLAFERRVIPEGPVKFIVSTLYGPSDDYFMAYYLEFDVEGGKQWRNIVISDRNYQVVLPLTREEQAMQMQRMGDPGYLRDYLAEAARYEYGPRAVGNFDSRGNFYWSNGVEYKISVLAPGAREPHLTVTRKYKPKPNSDAQKEALLESLVGRFRGIQALSDILTPAFLKSVLEKSELPPACKPVYGIIPMEKGFLVVHDANYATGSQTADVFTEKGSFAGQATLADWAFIAPSGFPKMVFRNGHAYTVTTDEDGENNVVRYKVGGQ